MKAWIFNIIAIVLIASPAWANEEGPTVIRKTFQVNKDVVLDLQTSFANVGVTTWPKNEMEVVITITVNARSEDRKRELLTRIKASIEDGADLARVKTELQSYRGRISESLEIDVTVKMPATGSVQGNVEFGNVKLPSLEGPVKLVVAYGNLVTGDLLSAANSCTVNFGNLKVQRFSGGKIHTEYGNADVQRITGSGEVRTEFGNIEIGPITIPSGELKLQVEYGSCKVNFTEGGDFTYDIRSSYGDIDLPSGTKGKVTKTDFSTESAKGLVGAGGGSHVIIRSEFGNVNVK